MGVTKIVEVMQKQTGSFSSGAVKGAQDQILDLRGFNNGGVSFTGNRYNPGSERSWLLGGEVRL